MCLYPREKISIRKFDLKEMYDKRDGHNYNILILGSFGTGKSFLAKDILYNYKHYPTSIIVSPTENDLYKNCVPSCLIYDDYDVYENQDITERILKCQRNLLHKLNNRQVNISEIQKFVLMEDCFIYNDIVKDKNVIEMMLNNRCYCMSLCVTSRTPFIINPRLRYAFDYIFILRENDDAKLLDIYKNYAQMFPSFHDFCFIMDELTQNYQCLVIDNCTYKPNAKLEDKIYWYKAEDHGNFKTSSPKIWDYEYQLNNQPNSNPNPNEIVKRKRIKRKIKKSKSK